MAGKTYDIAFQIQARLASGYTGVFSSAAATMGALQKRTSDLAKTTGKVENYQKLQQRITGNQAAMLAMRRQVDSSAAAMANPMSKEVQQLTKKADELQKKLDKDRAALAKLRPELVAAGVDTKNLGSEQARLASQTEKLAAARARMEQSQGAVQAARDRLSWNNMKGEVMASAGIALALGAPIKVAANFEQAMAKVGAVSGASAEDMAALTEQARMLGRDTQFTATQAGQAQEMLARASFGTQDILDTMPGMLSMAAAEGMDLAQAADIAASVLNGFSLEASQSGRVADVLAKASSASNTNIVGLGESMKYIAPVAKGLGIPLEDTAAMIGVMANAGIKGSEAGTALRASLLRLAKEPEQTAKALSDLGVKAVDTNGNLRTIPSLMQALSESMKDMGKADKMGELSKIFGTEATSGMLALMNAAEKGELSTLTDELYNAEGAAKTMENRMNDTAQGAMKRLSSATESVAIDIGNILLPTFTQGIEKLAVFMSKVSQFAQKHPQFTKILVGSVGALGVFKVGMTGLSIATTAAKLPFLEARAVVDKVRAAWVLADGSLIKMIKNTKLISAATKIWSGIQAAFNAVMALNPVVLATLAIIALVGVVIYAYKKFEWFRNLVDSVWEAIKTGISRVVAWYVEKWTMIGRFALNLCSSIAGFFSGAWEAIKTGVANVVGWYIEKWSTIGSFVMELCSSVIGYFASAWEAIKSGAAALVGWTTEQFEWMRSGVGLVVEAIKGFFGSAFGFIEEKIQGAINLWQKFKKFLGIAPDIAVPSERAIEIAAATGGASRGGAKTSEHRGSRSVKKLAKGGIFDGPQFALIAEAGREAVIPLEDRSRAIPLLLKAASLVGLGGSTLDENTRGMPLWKAAERIPKPRNWNADEKFSSTPPAPNVTNHFTFSFTIQGNAESGIEEKIRRGVMDAIREVEIQLERRAFA